MKYEETNGELLITHPNNFVLYGRQSALKAMLTDLINRNSSQIRYLTISYDKLVHIGEVTYAFSSGDDAIVINALVEDGKVQFSTDLAISNGNDLAMGINLLQFAITRYTNWRRSNPNTPPAADEFTVKVSHGWNSKIKTATDKVIVNRPVWHCTSISMLANQINNRGDKWSEVFDSKLGMFTEGEDIPDEEIEAESEKDKLREFRLTDTSKANWLFVITRVLEAENAAEAFAALEKTAILEGGRFVMPDAPTLRPPLTSILDQFTDVIARIRAGLAQNILVGRAGFEITRPSSASLKDKSVKLYWVKKDNDVIFTTYDPDPLKINWINVMLHRLSRNADFENLNVKLAIPSDMGLAAESAKPKLTEASFFTTSGKRVKLTR